MIHGVKHDLWHLRPGCVVEKDEAGRTSQGRKRCPNGFNRKTRLRCGLAGGTGNILTHKILTHNVFAKNILGFGLQTFAPGTSKKSAAVLRNEQRPTYTPLQPSSRRIFNCRALQCPPLFSEIRKLQVGTAVRVIAAEIKAEIEPCQFLSPTQN
jgi:hypothetical protein